MLVLPKQRTLSNWEKTVFLLTYLLTSFPVGIEIGNIHSCDDYSTVGKPFDYFQ